MFIMGKKSIRQLRRRRSFQLERVKRMFQVVVPKCGANYLACWGAELSRAGFLGTRIDRFATASFK